jgi:DNA-binding beta-propeller fold protein YncE
MLQNKNYTVSVIDTATNNITTTLNVGNILQELQSQDGNKDICGERADRVYRASRSATWTEK